MGGLFKPKVSGAPTFTGQDRENVIDPLIGQVGSLAGQFDPAALMNTFRTPYSGSDLEGQATQALLGFNPSSYFQGSQGMLGQAGGLFSDAAGQIGSDPLGAKSMFSSFLDPSFTDVGNNPQVQGVLNSLQNQGQQAFNIGADKIASSAARAAGGLGQSSAATNQLSKLQQNINQDLSNQAANILLGEQGRRQGYQMALTQQGLGQDLRQAEALGMLANQMGNLGMGQAGLGFQGVSGLADLGQRFASREMQGAMLPLQQQMALGQLLKGGTVQGPSTWDNINSALGGVGQAAGAAALMFSDRRMKEDIKEMDQELDEVMDELVPYFFKYIHTGEELAGVMAQDLEKSDIGAEIVVEDDAGLKRIYIPGAVSALLAMVARLNKRVRQLEAN